MRGSFHHAGHAHNAGDRSNVASQAEIQVSIERAALIAALKLISISVYPSGAAFATASVAMLLPAKVRFSTTDCCLNHDEKDCAIIDPATGRRSDHDPHCREG